jgi:HEAT repeat protein
MKLGFRLDVAAIAIAFLLAQPPLTFAQTDKKPNVDELIQRLEASEGHERDAVMEELDQIQDADVLVPPLLAALDRDDPQNARKLLDVLARFPGVQLTVPLVRLARRADPIPRGIEPFLVGEPARKELLKAVTEVCASWKPPVKNTDDAGEELTEAEKEERESDETRKSRRFIEWAGEALGHTDPAALGDLLAMLRDHSACRQAAAKDGLMSIVSEAEKLDPQVVKGVTTALGDADVGVQRAAVSILYLMNDRGTRVSRDMLKPLFLILKTHPDSGTRSAAFRLLRTAPGDTPIRAAEIAVHDPDGQLQDIAETLLEEHSAAKPKVKP